MALTSTPRETGIGKNIISQPDVVNTGHSNISLGPVEVYGITLAAGAGEVNYTKLYDDDGSNMAYDASDEPDLIVEMPATATTRTIHVFSDNGEGLKFVNGLSMAGSQEVGDELTAAPTDLGAHFVTN